MPGFLIEARHPGPADEARVAVIARPVIYAAVWRSSRNCHHARAPSAAALVTCAGLAAVAAAPPMALPRVRADSWPSRVRSRMYSRSLPDSAASTVNTTPDGSWE